MSEATMRFLGVGDWNDLGSVYLELLSGGHEVRVHASEPEAADILAGMVPRVEDRRLPASISRCGAVLRPVLLARNAGTSAPHRPGDTRNHALITV